MGNITLEQAVRNAIAVENAAEQFYRTLSESTHDEQASTFLDEMAEQEQSHQIRIKRLADKLRAGELPFRADDNIELVETAPCWADVDEIDYETALNVALENENHAVLFYGALSEASDGVISSFFETLMKDEEEHVVRLTERLEDK